MRRRLLLSMQNAASATVPRRWNVEADGIKWIPRMADKRACAREPDSESI